MGPGSASPDHSPTGQPREQGKPGVRTEPKAGEQVRATLRPAVNALGRIGRRMARTRPDHRDDAQTGTGALTGPQRKWQVTPPLGNESPGAQRCAAVAQDQIPTVCQMKPGHPCPP